MAKFSSEVVDGEILEGLLCPACYVDLKTVNQLLEHFEVAHATEDHDVLQTLKGFLGKAKRKILKQDNGTDDVNKPTFESPIESTLTTPQEVQEIGIEFSHTQYFKRLREKKVDRYVMETNKLLIRLDKLICDISEDPEKRKEFEKTIVPWVPDNDVPLCPGCAKSFGLSRRRHHCRLCGGVMCHSCSVFISYEFARKLTLPVKSSDDHLLIAKPNSSLRRPSSASLLSVMNINVDNAIRLCKDCHVLLERRDKLVEQKNHKPVIVQIYERLKDSMNEVEKLVPIYLEMIESLNSGETDFKLDDAQELKVKISKLAERIDSLSKRILKLDSSKEESNSRSVQLQSGIRMAASQFLRNMILGLPVAPTPEELSRYQSQRQAQIQQRIQMEKEAEMQYMSKKEVNKSSPIISPKQINSNPVSPDTGWCVTPNKVQQDADPMAQQIQIIHKYIQQARMDHKYDEVKMLENNLRELELEYSKWKSES